MGPPGFGSFCLSKGAVQKMADVRERQQFPATDKTHASHQAHKGKASSSPKANTCKHKTRPRADT